MYKPYVYIYGVYKEEIYKIANVFCFNWTCYLCNCTKLNLLLFNPMICSQFGIYSTRLRDSPLSCQIRRRNYQIRSITNLSEDPRVKYIFTPGIELEPSVKWVSKHCIWLVKILKRHKQDATYNPGVLL